MTLRILTAGTIALAWASLVDAACMHGRVEDIGFKRNQPGCAASIGRAQAIYLIARSDGILEEYPLCLKEAEVLGMRVGDRVEHCSPGWQPTTR